jgi:hypothetical protein
LTGAAFAAYPSKMEGITVLPRDEAAERQLEEQIRHLGQVLSETLRQLADAKAELEIRRRMATGSVPEWLRPKYVKRTSLAQDIISSLDHHLMNGLSFAQLEEALRRTGRAVHKPSLTAILGRLKREGKIVRHKGRWKLISYANGTYDEPEEHPTGRIRKGGLMSRVTNK